MKTVAWAVGAAVLVSVPILALPARNAEPVADRQIARSSGGAADARAPVEFVVRGKDGRADKVRIGF